VVVGLAYPSAVVVVLLLDMAAAHPRHGGPCADVDDRRADCRDNRGSLAGFLCRAPIWACRSRSSRSGTSGQLLRISAIIASIRAVCLRCCPIGGGGGGEGILSRRPISAMVGMKVKSGVGVVWCQGGVVFRQAANTRHFLWLSSRQGCNCSSVSQHQMSSHAQLPQAIAQS
jgi:hypothetical protein